MASRRWSLVATALIAAALPATASAALVKVADPINVAPDDKVTEQQYYPDVGMAADGSFAVSYSEGGGAFEQVYVQRFSAGFAKLGARIPVGLATQRNTLPAIAMASDGRFAVAFQTYSNFPATPAHFIEVQRFAADGTPVGGPIVPDGANADQDGEPPAVAMADDGRFAVAWITSPSTLSERSYSGSGTPQTPAQPLGTGYNSDATPSIGMTADGRYVLTAVMPSMYDPGTMTFSNELVPAWSFHADGTPDGGMRTLYTGPAGVNYADTAIGMAEDGSSFLAFADRHSLAPGGSESDIWARRFDAAGTPLGDRFIANDYTAYSQISPDVEVDDDGGVLLAFEGQNGTQRWGYLRHFAPGGTPDGIEEHVSTAPDGATQRIHVDTDGHARSAVAYQFSNQGTNNEVFVARWDYAGLTSPPPGGGDGTTPPSGSPAPVSGSGTSVIVKPPPAKAAAAVTIAQSVTFPSTKSCASRRNFKIRLRVPKGADVTQATVKVNGKRVAVRKGARLRSTVDLRTLPKGRFTVAIELKLGDGRTVKGQRKYRTCAAKGRGGKPKV
ncbi:MAG TPA: hypothetical protein VNT03_13530 [Baekduia sp.]|nr:hypothetical protein [Baekduia sp.]